MGGPGTQFKGPLRGSRAPGAWGYHQTRGHQNIITSLTLPLCNVECFMVSTVCTVACVVSTVCTIVFCMYIHCNHCMHCCVYSQGGIGNRRKQLEKENKCARATWLPQPPLLCSILYRQPPPPPLGVNDTPVFLLNEYIVELNPANFNILNQILN